MTRKPLSKLADASVYKMLMDMADQIAEYSLSI
jgi:hypothetical protein